MFVSIVQYILVYWASLSKFWSRKVKLLIWRRHYYTYNASAEGASEIFIDIYIYKRYLK